MRILAALDPFPWAGRGRQAHAGLLHRVLNARAQANGLGLCIANGEQEVLLFEKIRGGNAITQHTRIHDHLERFRRSAQRSGVGAGCDQRTAVRPAVVPRETIVPGFGGQERRGAAPLARRRCVRIRHLAAARLTAWLAHADGRRHSSHHSAAGIGNFQHQRLGESRRHQVIDGQRDRGILRRTWPVCRSCPSIAHTRCRLQQRQAGGRSDLTQRSDVVHDPERPPHGRNHQITSVHADIGDRRRRQVLLQRVPASAVVERNEESEFCPGVEQAGSRRILADNTRRVIRWNPVAAGGQPGPGRTIVLGAIDVGPQIVLAQETIDGYVGRALSNRRGLDVLDAPARRQILGSDIGPGPAIVTSHVDGPVVRADPDHSSLHARFVHRVDG